MNLLDLANAGMNTLATGLVASGGYLVFQGGRTVEGVILLASGLVTYVLYELLPSKPKQ